MRIDNHIYFAPGILLKDLDMSDSESLINSFEIRVNNYYLQPIKILNKIRRAFPVAIIEFSMIDALARYSTNNPNVGERIKQMIKDNFNTNENIAIKAYDEFRNGLLHENHIKNCGQLCYETSESFKILSGNLIINPLKLQRELDSYFKEYVNKLKTNYNVYEIFLTNIKKDFEEEVNFFKEL